MNNLSVFSGKNLVDTALSILNILFHYFIILNLNDDHATTYCIYHTEIFLTFGYIFIIYYINFSIIN